MESDGFNGVAIFIVLAVVTGVIGYLAVLQSKVKKQIEESRRERERAELTTLGATFVPTTPVAPSDATSVEPGTITDITPASLPKITPGGTPPPETGGHHHSTPPSPDSGTWSGGSGFDAGSGGSHHGGH
jgi:hypothetical protein